jgi:hypothetical protein
MRNGFLVVFSLPTTAAALERTLARSPDERDWAASSALCTLTYYNECTGWVWVWSGWDPHERIGVVFEPCCSNAVLVSSSLYVWTSAPTGYGFTGVLTIHEADDAGCAVEPALLGDIFMPRSDGWQTFVTNLPTPSRYLLSVEFGGTSGTPIALGSDHPAAGPTGPTACGFCYPSNRTTHSFRYGTREAPPCPGLPLFDGVCNAEFLWTATFDCGPSFAIESRSWAAVKALYR